MCLLIHHPFFKIKISSKVSFLFDVEIFLFFVFLRCSYIAVHFFFWKKSYSKWKPMANKIIKMNVIPIPIIFFSNINFVSFLFWFKDWNFHQIFIYWEYWNNFYGKISKDVGKMKSWNNFSFITKRFQTIESNVFFIFFRIKITFLIVVNWL